MLTSSQTKLIPIKVKEEISLAISPLRYHTIGFVYSGQKVVFENDKRHDFYAGTLFCFNQYSYLGFYQAPYQNKPYYTQLLLVSTQDIDRFEQMYPSTHITVKTVFSISADENIMEIWQRINNDFAKNNAVLHQHRLFELLLILRDYGWQFINAKDITISDQIEKIIQTDITYDWQKTEIAEQLNMSVSKLSRQLQADGITFSEILRNTRMTQAIYLLLSANYSVNEVASLSGYQSHSKFTATFKRVFGFLPSQLENHDMPGIE